jgi:hypothetical protein
MKLHTLSVLMYETSYTYRLGFPFTDYARWFWLVITLYVSMWMWSPLISCYIYARIMGTCFAYNHAGRAPSWAVAPSPCLGVYVCVCNRMYSCMCVNTFSAHNLAGRAPSWDVAPLFRCACNCLYLVCILRMYMCMQTCFTATLQGESIVGCSRKTIINWKTIRKTIINWKTIRKTIIN